jgi:hypothetical protein
MGRANLVSSETWGGGLMQNMAAKLRNVQKYAARGAKNSISLL